MRSIIALQMYIAFAQGVVSPVAYLPAEAIAQGYRVVAELSQGWIGETVPFYRSGRWEMAQRIFLGGDSVVLYIEGAVGRLSVYQDRRLLWQGEMPTIQVLLIGQGRTQLRLTGENGGVTGGIYLLARADTQVWQHASYPESLARCDKPVFYFSSDGGLSVSPLMRVRESCASYSFFPPARVQVVLQKCGHGIFLHTSSGSETAAGDARRGVSRLAFVLLWLSMAVLGGFFSDLRTAFWAGWWQPVPSGLLESVLGAAWLSGTLLALLPAEKSLLLFDLFLLYLLLESLVFERLMGAGQWAWQSWLLPAGGLLIAGFLVPGYLLYGMLLAWAIRALRFILHFPRLAYLCTAEVFLAILLLRA